MEVGRNRTDSKTNRLAATQKVDEPTFVLNARFSMTRDPSVNEFHNCKTAVGDNNSDRHEAGISTCAAILFPLMIACPGSVSLPLMKSSFTFTHLEQLSRMAEIKRIKIKSRNAFENADHIANRKVDTIQKGGRSTANYQGTASLTHSEFDGFLRARVVRTTRHAKFF